MFSENREMYFAASELEDFASAARQIVRGLAPRKPSKRTGAYNSWKHAKDRCFNPDSPGFHRYGARGITMCDRWRHSFPNFFADMGVKPAGKTLDRIDNDGNYEPGNCRWATPLEQTRNQPHRRRYEWAGEMLCLAEVAEKVGLGYQFLRKRVQRGMNLHDAIALPVYAGRGARKQPAQPKKPNGKLAQRADWFDLLASEPSNIKAAALLNVSVRTVEHFRSRYVKPRLLAGPLSEPKEGR